MTMNDFHQSLAKTVIYIVISSVVSAITSIAVLQSKITDLDRRVQYLEAQLDVSRQAQMMTADRLARIETKLDALLDYGHKKDGTR